jgi:hypothetical protein
VRGGEGNYGTNSFLICRSNNQQTTERIVSPSMRHRWNAIRRLCCRWLWASSKPFWEPGRQRDYGTKSSPLSGTNCFVFASPSFGGYLLAGNMRLCERLDMAILWRRFPGTRASGLRNELPQRRRKGVFCETKWPRGERTNVTRKRSHSGTSVAGAAPMSRLANDVSHSLDAHRMDRIFGIKPAYQLEIGLEA